MTISDAAFLPLGAAMIAIYVGTGLVGVLTGDLSRWLAIALLMCCATYSAGGGRTGNFATQSTSGLRAPCSQTLTTSKDE